jgi:hypothetical protein
MTGNSKYEFQDVGRAFLDDRNDADGGQESAEGLFPAALEPERATPLAGDPDDRGPRYLAMSKMPMAARRLRAGR